MWLVVCLCVLLLFVFVCGVFVLVWSLFGFCVLCESIRDSDSPMLMVYEPEICESGSEENVCVCVCVCVCVWIGSAFAFAFERLCHSPFHRTKWW